MLDEGCLFCSDFQMCFHIGQVRIRLELHSSTFSDCVSSGLQWCSLCSECHLLQLSGCKGLGASFPPTTASRVLALPHEQQRKTSQAAFPATLQQQNFKSALSRLRDHDLNLRCGEGGCNGLMKCQDETLSTLVNAYAKIERQ